jgi:hypothetical protein
MEQNYRRQYSGYISSFEILPASLFGHPVVNSGYFVLISWHKWTNPLQGRKPKHIKGRGIVNPGFNFKKLWKFQVLYRDRIFLSILWGNNFAKFHTEKMCLIHWILEHDSQPFNTWNRCLFWKPIWLNVALMQTFIGSFSVFTWIPLVASHMWTKKNPLDLIFFHCTTCIMYAFGVLNRTHSHVTELHLVVQAFHFSKCPPSFLEISLDPCCLPTGSHRKKHLNKNLKQVFTFSRSPWQQALRDSGLGSVPPRKGPYSEGVTQHSRNFLVYLEGILCSGWSPLPHDLPK